MKGEIAKIKSVNGRTWKEIEQKYKENLRALESQIWSQYQDKGHKFNIELLTEDDQAKYFDQAAALRKERDMALAQNEYFDKFRIKSIRLEKFKQQRLAYIGVRDEILLNNKKLKDAKKSLKFLAKNELDPHRIEEILVNSWNQIQAIKLENETVSKTKFMQMQDSLKAAAQSYNIINPAFNEFKTIQEGGNN